jgi:rod shape-determining protein MreD
MDNGVDAATWVQRAVFVALACVIMIAALVPLDQRPATFAAPDLLLACACVWVARRPDYLPLPIIALVFFAADMFFQRPPGLWAALVVLLTETIRARNRDLRTMALLAEWGFVAIGLCAITLANRLVLAIVMTPQAPLGLTLMQLVATIAIYPVVVMLAYLLFGISRQSPDTLRSTRSRR